MGQGLYVVKYRGTGCCKTGHGFKKGIGERGNGVADNKRQTAEKGEKKPDTGDGKITVFFGQYLIGSLYNISHTHSCNTRNDSGIQKCQGVTFPIQKGNQYAQ